MDRIISLDGHFNQYMESFELTIMAVGAIRNLIGHEEVRTVTPGKLHRTAYGCKMGSFFTSSVPFAIDYYGHLKKSSGLNQIIADIRKQCFGKQVKSMSFWVVHFASVRIETIAHLNHQLVGGFPLFKREILESRGFKPNFCKRLQKKERKCSAL